MRKLAILASVMVFAAGAVAFSPEAEARRRGYGGVGAGIVAAAIIGGIIAASAASQRRHYSYYPRRNSYYYGPTYSVASPVYGYSSYSAPTYYYRSAVARPVYSRAIYSRPAYSRTVYGRPAFAYRSAPIFRPARVHRAGVVGGRGHGGGRRGR